MQNDGTPQLSKWNNKAERICVWGICILSAICMLPIWAVTLRWSQPFWGWNTHEYMDSNLDRIPDGIKSNLLFCAVIVFFFCFLGLLFKTGKIRQLHIHALAVFIAVCGGIFSWIYLRQLRPIQHADFWRIVSIGQMFASKNFSQFHAGEYLATYPHQLGLICLMALFVKTFGGAYATMAFQAMNCICIGLILFQGYRVVHQIWENKEIDVIFIFLQGLCLPLYFYAGLVYGEIISILLLYIGINAMVHMIKSSSLHCRHIITLLISTGLAVTFRKNSLIILIAMSIIIIISMIAPKKFLLGSVLVILALSALFPTFLRNFVFGKFPVEGAMPTSMWIYIGMEDGSGFGYGAYDGRAAVIFEEAQYNTALADQMTKELIEERILLPLFGKKFYGSGMRQLSCVSH